MVEFKVGVAEAPKEQQFRIYDAASAAWRLLYTHLAPEEVLAAVATIAAMDIGVKLFGEEDEAKALDYLRKTAVELLPEVRRIKAAGAKEGAH